MEILHEQQESNIELIYRGKVRDVYNISSNLLAMVHSDRLSAFNKHVCKVSGKGSILTAISKWWFEKTKDIIPNHYIWSKNNVMVCKKCKPFKVEIIVRGYITGSLWNNYSKGIRNYCGVSFPDNLVKNQILDNPVITPTTKDDDDLPISKDDIIKEGYMTQQQWDYINNKAIELFKYGQTVADSVGLLLVDTKYEFGIDNNGNILLIDEIHTCDSSRYWIKDTYSLNREPDILDKDIIRNYIRSKCNPYTDTFPSIPDRLITETYNVYKKLYCTLNPKNCDTLGPVVDSANSCNINKIIDSYYNDIHNN